MPRIRRAITSLLLVILSLVVLYHASPFPPVFGTAPYAGTDVRVTSTNSLGQYEVTTAVDPGNNGHLLGGYIESNPTNGHNQLGRAVSTDLGATWSTSLFSYFSVFDWLTDPAVAFDRAGTGYFVGLALLTSVAPR